jgi:hypothetical protein
MTWDSIVPIEGETIEYRIGAWHIHATWPMRRRHDRIETNLTVMWNGADRQAVAVPEMRLNLTSGTGRDGVARSMRAICERNDAEWERVPAIVAALIQDLIGWYRSSVEQPSSLTDALDEIQRPESWLLYPIWPARGSTGVAAAPEAYKSMTALAIGLSVAYGTSILHHSAVTIPVRNERRKVLYLDWEADRQTTRMRAAALMRGAGLPPGTNVGATFIYHRPAAPLSDVIWQVRDMVKAGDFDCVIIDSMSAAIGGSMVDDDSVNQFWSAVDMLRLPAMVIAHKSLANQRDRSKAFFGSAMSAARVRLAWNVETPEQSTDVVWECFKDNNSGMRGRKLAWEVGFENHGEGPDRYLHAITFDETDPDLVLFDAGTDEARPPTQGEQLVNWFISHGEWAGSREIAEALDWKQAAIATIVKRTPEVVMHPSSSPPKYGLISWQQEGLNTGGKQDV